jgi:hypothetical protein
MVSPLDAKAKELLDGMEGVTPGPWQTSVSRSSVGLEKSGYAHSVSIGTHVVHIAFTRHQNYDHIHKEPIGDGYYRYTGIGPREPDLTLHPDAAHIARCSPENLRPILEAFTAQAERIAELDLLYKALTELSEHNYRMASNRAEAAEAEVRTLREDVQQFMDRLGPHWFLEQNWFPESAAALRAKEP